MTAMHAVEVPDGDDASSREVDGAEGILDDLQTNGS
jgi:hypothetical protein